MSDIGFTLLKNAELQREDEAKNASSVSNRQIAASGAALMIPGSQVLTACSQDEIEKFFRTSPKVDMNTAKWDANGQRFIVGDTAEHFYRFMNKGKDGFMATHYMGRGADGTKSSDTMKRLECKEVCPLFECVFPKAGGQLSENEALARLAQLKAGILGQNITADPNDDNIEPEKNDAGQSGNNEVETPKETDNSVLGKNTKSDGKSSTPTKVDPSTTKGGQSQSANNNAKPDGNLVPDKSASGSTAKKSSSTAKTPTKNDPPKTNQSQSQSTDEQVAKSVPEKSKPASSTKKNSGSSKGGVLEKKSPGTGAMKPQEGTCSRLKDWFLGCCRKN